MKLLIDIDVSAHYAYMILTTKNYKNKVALQQFFYFNYKLLIQNYDIRNKILRIAKTGSWQADVLVVL